MEGVLSADGQTRLAELLGWDGSKVRRKLSEVVKITKADALAVRAAIAAQSEPG